MGFRETNNGTCISLNLSTFPESTLKQLDYVREFMYFWGLRLDFLFILEKCLFLGEHNLLSLLRLFDKNLSMSWLPCHFLMLLGEWCFSAAWNVWTLVFLSPGTMGCNTRLCSRNLKLLWFWLKFHISILLIVLSPDNRITNKILYSPYSIHESLHIYCKVNMSSALIHLLSMIVYP